MQTINNIYKYFTLLAATVLICVGCQKESEEWMPIGKKNVMIELSVEAAELTRATPTDMEKIIHSLRIYAFFEGRQAGYIYRASTAPGTPFYMDLELPENGVHDVDFYVIANDSELANENSVVSLGENMTKAQLEVIRFTSLTTGQSLPMYAKKTAAINVDAINSTLNEAVGHENHFVLTQTIAFSLERPIAKLSVYAAKIAGTQSNPQISKVELLSGGTRQYNYLFPQNEEILGAIPSRANNRTLLNSVVTVNKEINKESSEVNNPASYSDVVIGPYLSEVSFGATAWDVPSGNDKAAALRVEYALGEGQEIKNAFIYLPKVQRNHHIKVCILINAEGQLIVNYDVADWDDHAMPNYKFEYPTHSYLRESIPTTGTENSVPSAAATMKENVPFKGYFQMTQPAIDQWTPTLLGLNASNCEIRVFEADTNIEIATMDFPISASDKWYRIEVWPLDGGNMPVGEEVRLAISYTATGLTESEFLLINGSAQEFYWPYTGTSVQDANYVIITMVN